MSEHGAGFLLRRGVVAVTLGLSGTLCAIALGSEHASRDTTSVSLSTFSVPITVPPPTITSTLGASTTDATVGVPFTLTLRVQDSNVSMAWTGLVNGFGGALTIQSAQSVGACNLVQTQLQCPLGGLGPGDSLGATIVVVATAPGSYTFTANHIGSSDTTATANATVTVNVAAAPVAAAPTTTAAAVAAPARADLSVEAQGTLRGRLDHTTRVRLLVRNGGPVGDSSTALSLQLPAQVRLLAASPHAGRCSLEAHTCRLGPLAAHAGDAVTLTLRAVKAGQGRLVARVSGDLADPSTRNNRGTIVVRIAGSRAGPKRQ
jgi:Domain of unknown function DUF11